MYQLKEHPYKVYKVYVKRSLSWQKAIAMFSKKDLKIFGHLIENDTLAPVYIVCLV